MKHEESGTAEQLPAQWAEQRGLGGYFKIHFRKSNYRMDNQPMLFAIHTVLFLQIRQQLQIRF